MAFDSSAYSADAIVTARPSASPVSRNASTATGEAPHARLGTIDAVRGLAIVLMVLDHTRDFFQSNGPAPTNLSRTDAVLFFTRWITHCCAPTFVFLAGTSAHFMGRRMSAPALRRHLLLRGAFLIVLEFTLVNFAWHFNVSYRMGLVMQVIWAIGVSMCVLGLSLALPRAALFALGLGMVFAHNLLDGVRPEQFGAFAALWQVLHVQGPLALGFVHYPLIPWVGVMMLGYLAGQLFELPASVRQRQLRALGFAACTLFVLLRLFNGYGDPKPWSAQKSPLFTALSFLNVSKYPPSLDYLLCTLGLMLLALAWFDARRTAPPRLLVLFGQVPLFAYVAHLGLVHLLAGLTALYLGHGTAVLTNFFLNFPKDFGVSLPTVYMIWLVVLACLVPACHWFSQYKRARPGSWLRYV